MLDAAPRLTFSDYTGKYAIEETPLNMAWDGVGYRVIECGEAGHAYVATRPIELDGNGNPVRSPAEWRCSAWMPVSPPLDNPLTAKARCDSANEVYRAFLANLREGQGAEWINAEKARMDDILNGRRVG
jgi:uncharacterized protein (DUF1810 family)